MTRRREAYLTQSAAYNWAAHTVGFGQIQLVLACVAVPFAPRHSGDCIASLVNSHVTPLAITQQNLIPAGEKYKDHQADSH